MGVLFTGTGAGTGEAALTADTELELEVMEVTVSPDTPPLLEVSAPLLLPLFFAETLLSSDWLLQHSYKLAFARSSFTPVRPALPAVSPLQILLMVVVGRLSHHRAAP